MLNLSRNAEKFISRNIEKQLTVFYSSSSTAPSTKNDGEFRALNLKTVKTQLPQRRPARPIDVLPPRSTKMPVDQNWGNVWPGPRSFHPATVPLPVRQGYTEKGAAPPAKYANAELMKIPNFLHLTPPVIKRQCEALKKFCTPWPKALNTDEKCSQYFPLEISSSNYCHSSPTIRDPLARIVTLRVNVNEFKFDARARDKLLRLVGDRYDEKTGLITIVTDRCPTRKQNWDYAMYLLTALYHESLNVEPWEELKSEADMERFEWENSVSQKSVEALFQKSSQEIPQVDNYALALDRVMNEGENDYTINNYGESVRKLLNLPKLSS